MSFYALSFNNEIRKMMAASRDTLMKAISEVFGRISTHFDWYSDDFLSNSLFEFFQGVKPIVKTFCFRQPHKNESQMLKSAECADHPTLPLRKTRRVEDFCRSFINKTQAIYAVAPYDGIKCHPYLFPRLALRIVVQKNFRTWKHNVELLRLRFVSILLKIIKPNYPQILKSHTTRSLLDSVEVSRKFTLDYFHPNNKNIVYYLYCPLLH